MRTWLLTTILLFSLSLTGAYGQSAGSGPELHAPVEFPMRLSGNFGELRSGHFHAGIDIKTQGVTGKPIHAIADGHVSRIKVSATGYGHALYIHHPQHGLTSVYAHLKSFAPELDEHVKNKQYKQKNFEIQLFPEKGQFRVKRGEIIGYSGNTGSSQGPHLHFETRDLNRQEPLNPLRFNWNIPDHIPPKIFNVALYPLGPNARVDGQTGKKFLDVAAINKNRFKVLGEAVPKVHGKVGFAIRAFDFLDGAPNWCGLYTLKMYVDSVLMYHHRMDRFSFYETRYINSLIDYEEKVENSHSYQKTFREPNNQLDIYEYLRNNGVCEFRDDSLHTITFRATDAQGNSSELYVKVKGQRQVSASAGNPQSPRKKEVNGGNPVKVMPYAKSNSFKRADIRLQFPKNAFYDTVRFEYSKDTIARESGQFYSDLHHIHRRHTPVHKKFSLSIEARELPDMLREKAFIARVDEEENTYEYAGGEPVNGFISTQTRSFGKYAIMVDQKPPTIKPFVINEQKISFKIDDHLSGVDSYNGYINGQWVLFEYDPKNNLLFYRVDTSRLKKSESYNLELYVSDAMNNVATYHETIMMDMYQSHDN